MNSSDGACAGIVSALETALDALEEGLSPLPPVEDGTKRPLADIPDGEQNGKQQWTWKPYCQTPATREKVRRWFKGDRQSIGLVTGFNDLECFEFDCPETHKRFLEAAAALGLSDLVAKIRAGYEEKTPGLGYHWLYYCDELRGNQKLAERIDPIDAQKRIVLIETRGEGGFIIIAPSKGRVHPSGSAYELLSGGLRSIVTLTSEERESLWDLARTFDELPLVEEVKPPRQSISRKLTDPDVRPGDDYEASSTWEDLLEPLGWVRVFTRGDTTYWRRPGKDKGVSATTGHCKGLYVFSTSTSFEARTSYSKFGAYARLHQAGEHHAAAKALTEAGYGSQAKYNAGNGNASAGTILEPWPELFLSEGPEAVPFPVEVFPEALKRFCLGAARVTLTPPDIVGASMLAVASAAIGQSVQLSLKRTWKESTLLYVLIVADPGRKKSPASTLVIAPLMKIDAQLRNQCREEQAIWDADRKDKNKETRTPPLQRCAIVKDITRETLVAILADNPRGVLVDPDEATSWVASFNEYKAKGSDRQFWLSIWGASQYPSIGKVGAGHYG